MPRLVNLSVTLILLFVYLKRAKRPLLPVAIPMVFLVVMTTIAGVMNLTREFQRPEWNPPVVIFGTLFLLLEALILIEAGRTLFGRRAAPPAA